MRDLAAYDAKRDFDRTPEPSGREAPSGPALRYGVQMHDATRLHFDLRLEWEGVLLSWAVTRGPSLDPGEKRVAVRTEDHPLGYLSFEGTIPKGSYGAGTVMLWDLGHWQPTDGAAPGLEKGHLRFTLHGARLTGAWHLVRMRGRRAGDGGRENWLLIKQEDAAAGRRDPVRRWRRSVSTRRTLRQIAAGSDPVAAPHQGSRPQFRKPQLASLTDAPRTDPAWWHEPKLDGYRALVALGGDGPRVYTRSGKDWTDRFASLLPSFEAVEADTALLDGEIVAGAGLRGFSALQEALSAGGPFTFVAFDLLEVDGADLTPLPLTERRDRLDRILRPVPPLGQVRISPIVEGDAEAAFDAVCAAGGEGLIAKRRDAPYRSTRTKAWLKVKCAREGVFAIIGWQPSERPGRPFASLLLAQETGRGLRYAGRVGTGFDAAALEDIAAALAEIAVDTPRTDVPKRERRGARWVAPGLAARVRYAEFTADGLLRHARFEGLAKAPRPAAETGGRVPVAGVGISSPDRVVFPDAGLRKLDVATYYDAVAERMLRTCADRPLSLVRLPDGLTGQRFFQKHAGPGWPDAIRTVDLAEADGQRATYMYVTDAAGLVGAAQMGTLEVHIWGARRDRLDRPDRLVFDLDPDEGLGFSEVAQAAHDLRGLLEDLGLPSWPLLTGGKGVHVVVPLRRVAGWETVKLYARLVAIHLATAEPDRFTAEMAKAKRRGRIFVDWLRNERGATAVAPFSLRARPGAPVAVPVAWDEITGGAVPPRFPLAAALERSWSDAPVPDPVGLTQARVARLRAVLDRGD